MNKKTFVITGGHSSNKGAQAMVFAVVQELKKNYPDCEIWMFSNQRNENDNYKFNVLTWHLRDILRLLLGKFSFIIKPSFKKNEYKIHEIYKKANKVFDVSGFALSSQFGFKTSLKYILRIVLAKKYKTELVLLPQSFGPFNYEKKIYKVILFPLMKRYLRYPTIFSREKQGYEDLKRFTTGNLFQALDVVLLTERPKRDVIYKNGIHVNKKNNSTGKSMAIIPNTKILKWNKDNDIFAIYKKMIEILLNGGYTIYILRHSQEDLEFCQQIAALIKDEQRIKLLVDNYNCIELNEIISQMDFVVASRYHSLVHAYKSEVPAVVIGWAEKYPEIMSQFDQKKYYLDIRKKIDSNQAINMLNSIISNNDESKKIRDGLEAYKNSYHVLMDTFK